jgi:hypothetical protein
VNAKQKQAIQSLIELGVDPTEAARLVLAPQAVESPKAAGPVRSAATISPVFSLDDIAAGKGYPCTASKPCKRLLRHNGPRSTRHGPRGHTPVR